MRSARTAPRNGRDHQPTKVQTTVQGRPREAGFRIWVRLPPFPPSTTVPLNAQARGICCGGPQCEDSGKTFRWRCPIPDGLAQRKKVLGAEAHHRRKAHRPGIGPLSGSVAGSGPTEGQPAGCGMGRSRGSGRGTWPSRSPAPSMAYSIVAGGRGRTAVDRRPSRLGVGERRLGRAVHVGPAVGLGHAFS